MWYSLRYVAKSRPAWGAWIETSKENPQSGQRQSRPAWGAWIETGTDTATPPVSPRRAPHGARGLKLLVIIYRFPVAGGRAPHGARGLKHLV